MRFIGMTLALLAAGCASAPYVSPGVTAPYATALDAGAYNREIEKQGLRHYCTAVRCDTLPRLLVGYVPDFPASMLATGTSGQATIIFTVPEDGIPSDFRVESESAPEFGQAAIEALRQWRFQPATFRGKPVSTTNRQIFPFEIREAPLPE